MVQGCSEMTMKRSCSWCSSWVFTVLSSARSLDSSSARWLVGGSSLRRGGVRTAMAKGAVMPLPKTATDSKSCEVARSFSIWPGATYFALGGLELFLEAADEAEAAELVDDAAVAGAEEAVVGEDFGGELGVAVVAEHVHGALDLDFAFGGDAGERPGAGVADVADARLAGQRDVRDAGLGHAVAFEKVEAHLEIPLDDFDGSGRAAGADEARADEAEVGEDFFADDLADDGDGEETV